MIFYFNLPQAIKKSEYIALISEKTQILLLGRLHNVIDKAELYVPCPSGQCLSKKRECVKNEDLSC